MGTGAGRKITCLHRGGLDARLHEGRDVEPGLHVGDLLPAEPRPRVRRDKEGAAVGVGLVRGLERIEPPGLVSDLDLVHADQGRSTGSPATSSMRARLWRVCEATCPRLSPVTSASAPDWRASASAIRTMRRR